MMQKINPSRLRYRIQFGHYETKTNRNGVNINGDFVTDTEVWGGIYTNSMTQQYILMGQNISDVKSFIVRHNDDLQKCKVLKFNDEYYSDLKFNMDPYNNHRSFDIVTGKVVKKRGG